MGGQQNCDIAHRACAKFDGTSLPTFDAAALPTFGRAVDAATSTSHYISPPRERVVKKREGAALDAEERWNATLLLWSCMWSDNRTFLHIAKTGGSAIELVDATAPRLRFDPMYTLRRVDGSRVFGFDAAARGCYWWPRAHDADSVARLDNPNVVHLTPALWSRCFGAQWTPYERRAAGRLYCVVRDPIERFVSEFLFARLHWYWPSRLCPLKTPWERRKSRLLQEIWCFAALTYRLVASYNEQAASAPPAALNLSELVTHLLPQAAYIADATGAPACDIVFTHADVRAASLPPHVNEVGGYLHGGRARKTGRAFLRHYIRTNASLLALLQQAYPDDFALWDRASRRQRPTPRHRSLTEHMAELRRDHPALPRHYPSCEPPACSCAPCCRAPPHAAVNGRYEPFRCLSCVLSHPECGGLGVRRAWRPPRAMGALCGVGVRCNTCSACCGRPWVDVSGASCEQCERTECATRAVAASATGAPAVRAQAPAVVGTATASGAAATGRADEAAAAAAARVPASHREPLGPPYTVLDTPHPLDDELRNVIYGAVPRHV